MTQTRIERIEAGIRKHYEIVTISTFGTIWIETLAIVALSWQQSVIGGIVGVVSTIAFGLVSILLYLVIREAIDGRRAWKKYKAQRNHA